MFSTQLHTFRLTFNTIAYIVSVWWGSMLWQKHIQLGSKLLGQLWSFSSTGVSKKKKKP